MLLETLQMKNYYTLREEMKDAEELNGRILIVQKHGETKHLRFFDALSREWLRETSKLKKKVETKDGIVFITESGSIYDLVNVKNLLPTHNNK